MLELIKKYRNSFLTGFLLLLAFMIFAGNLKNRQDANIFERTVLTVFSPFFNVCSKLTNTTGGFWGDYIALVGVRSQNRALLEQLRVMNGRLLTEQEALLSNERLKGLLQLKGTLRYPSVAASIIGEDAAPWFRTLTVDRGASDGLQEGMPVVASDGVVGQLVKVADNTSRVLVVTDHSSAIAVIIQRSRARGVVRGAGNGRLTLEFAIREDDVKVGDQVITSGIGGTFPKGIPVGEVTMVKKGEYGIFQTVEVRPAAMISRLEEVLVLLKKRND